MVVTLNIKHIYMFKFYNNKAAIELQTMKEY